MTRTGLLCAIVVICWSGSVTGVAGCQAAPALVLPDPLRGHVKEEQFGIVTSIRGLPLGVRDALQTLFGSPTLDIADPSDSRPLAEDKPADSRPTRRMIVAGCSQDHCIVYYERGGGPAHSWHVALFHWRPDSTRFEWGGLAPSGLRSIEEVRKAMLSGAITGPSQDW